MTTTNQLATTDPAISFTDVVVEFPDPNGGVRRILDGINLTIEDGEFVALVGKTGCGKTTLLNMVAALVEPTAGTVQVGEGRAKAARHRMGFMLARDALLPWRSALRNVEYGLELRGMDKRARRQIARRWLEAVHLPHAEGLWPWQLSQGMRQRVALARTWALDPDILLMDEPFAALDVNTRVALQAEFLRLWQSENRKTVIFVTHDLTEAISLADRVVVLGDGGVLADVQVGISRPRDLEEVTASDRFLELTQQMKSLI